MYYENFENLCVTRGVKPSNVSKATGISTATLTSWKQGKYTPKNDKLQKIAEYFGVSLDYLTTGRDADVPNLTKRDERDISKDLDRIMGEIQKGNNEPLYYNGVEIDDASIGLLRNAIEFALRETKKENKVKYNPNKNKK